MLLDLGAKKQLPSGFCEVRRCGGDFTEGNNFHSGWRFNSAGLFIPRSGLSKWRRRGGVADDFIALYDTNLPLSPLSQSSLPIWSRRLHLYSARWCLSCEVMRGTRALWYACACAHAGTSAPWGGVWCFGSISQMQGGKLTSFQPFPSKVHVCLMGPVSCMTKFHIPHIACADEDHLRWEKTSG